MFCNFFFFYLILNLIYTPKKTKKKQNNSKLQKKKGQKMNEKNEIDHFFRRPFPSLFDKDDVDKENE